MSYNVRGVTLASVWVLWRITRNHLLSYLVVIAFLPLFFFFIFLYFLSFLSSSRPNTWPGIVTRSQKDHKKAWYSGSTQYCFKICLREDRQFDGLHKSIKIVIIGPIKINQIVFYLKLSLIFLMASKNT